MPEENRFVRASVRRTDLARLNGRPSVRQQLGNLTRPGYDEDEDGNEGRL